MHLRALEAQVEKLVHTKYAWAQETVIACGILHNIGIKWADAVPDDEVALPPPPPSL